MNPSGWHPPHVDNTRIYLVFGWPALVTYDIYMYIGRTRFRVKA